MDIRTLIEERFAPTVLVTATPAAEALVQTKNGLSIVDILRPYSHVRNLNACIRVGEVSPRITELKLRFHGGNTAFQPKTEAIDEHLKELLTKSAHSHAKQESFDELLQQMQSGSGSDPTPWYRDYRAEFFRMLSFGEHETLDHPLACIWVVPADVQDPVSHFEQLKLQTHLPPLMDKDVMYPVKDAGFPRHYVLLHDAGSGDEKKARDNLTVIARSYGTSSCSILRINSGRGTRDTMGAAPDIFKRCRKPVVTGGGAGEPDARPSAPPHGLGAFLAPQDLDAVAAFISEFTSATLLPRLEERITRLNAMISATRKGLRNKLSRLWKANQEGAASDAPYPWHSVESQMRQVGDLGFLLGQYAFAAATYRLAAGDYLNSGNNKWYAGVEEMIGLCCIMDPANESNDPLKYFSRAYESYTKCPGKVNRMLATRAMMLAAAWLTNAGRHQAANHVLMRAHFEEENARAALLLEQAAFALLALKPAMVRKFAFQIVLAGLRYYSCGQKRLAIHAYRQVMGVYHKQAWRYIEEHLNDILGKQYREGGELDRALWHFANLLAATHRPAATQQHYVQQFLDAVQKLEAKQGGAQVMDNLVLPTVNTGEVQVIYNDQRCYGNVGAYQVPDAAWAKLEAVVANDAPSNWLDGYKATYQDEEYNTCVAGEEISVDVEFRNPLAVQLKLSEVRLIAEFKASGEGARPSDPDGEHPLAPGPQQVQIAASSFTLGPQVTQVEQLVVRPHVAGWLRLVGVQWRVNEGVEGRVYFDIKGRRRKNPKGGRPGQQKHYPPYKRLLFSVIPAMPHLAITSAALPRRLYQGELCRTSVSLTNQGSLPLANLQLVMSGGAAVCAASNSSLSKDAAAHWQDEGELALQRVELQGGGTAYLFRFPAGTELAPGASLQWPLWLHPSAPVALDFQLLWYYEAAGGPDSSAGMKFRTLRMAHSVPVAPLLRVLPTVAPSSKDLYRYMLRLEVDNSREGEVVELQQVTAMSDGTDGGWRLASLTTAEGQAASTSAAAGKLGHTLQRDDTLQLGDSSSIFFVLQPPNIPRQAAAGSSGSGGEAAAGEEAAAEPAAVSAASGQPVLSGPLAFFCKHEKQAAAAAASLAALAAGGGDDREASTTQQLLSDPPVDVAVLWRTQGGQEGAAAGPLGGGSSGEGGGGRVGLFTVFNCCGNLQSNLIRVLLQPEQLQVQHDFRHMSMCVAPITLTVRNCSSRQAQLTIQTGETMSGAESQHAWFAAPSPSSPLAAGASRGQLAPFGNAPGQQAAGSVPGSPTAAATADHIQAGLPPAPEHIWCGSSTFTVACLPPGGVATAPLQVAVFKPGVYILDDYCASLHFAELQVEQSRRGEAVALRVDSA